MTEFQLSVAVFIIGLIMVIATLVMIIQGHRYWSRMDRTEEAEKAKSERGEAA